MNAYRILLVGCGVISMEWLTALKDRTDCQIVAMVDRRPEAAG